MQEIMLRLWSRFERETIFARDLSEWYNHWRCGKEDTDKRHFDIVKNG